MVYSLSLQTKDFLEGNHLDRPCEDIGCKYKIINGNWYEGKHTKHYEYFKKPR